MKQEQIIENLLEFAPNVLGVCPECGEAVLFDGWRCFNCGFDPKEMTGKQKLDALDRWSKAVKVEKEER